MDPLFVNVLALAYLGDAVYELKIRKVLVSEKNVSAGSLHREALRYVSAARQSKACPLLQSLLSEDEASVFIRARNANPPHVPKSAELSEYHYATALEAVFGYLSLKGEETRIEELFRAVYDYLSTEI